ncbi:hypothetical protein ACSLOD_27945, partial [Escherichia coli]
LQLRIFTGDEILPALVSTLKSDEDNPNIIEGASSWFDIQAPQAAGINTIVVSEDAQQTCFNAASARYLSMNELLAALAVAA